MNTLEFCSMHPSNSIEMLFREHFKEFMAAYDLLEGVRFYRIDNIDVNESIIVYSVILEGQDISKLLTILNRTPIINSLGSCYNINAWVDNSCGLLYIKLNKI